MESLHDTYTNSRSNTTVAFWIFIILICIFIVSSVFITYLYIHNISFGGIQKILLSRSFPIENILYIFVAIIFIVICVMLFNSQYDIGISKKPPGINRKLPPSGIFWKIGSTKNPLDPTNLIVESENFVMTAADTYTMSVEININDTRTINKNGPYRHLLHRGSDEIKTYMPISPEQSGRGDINDGLPVQMNPGIFIDKFKNDLIIFIDTDGGKESYRESVRIQDAPLNEPFRLLITVHDSTAEIFLNCKLVANKLLKGTPRGVPNNWFGRTGFSKSSAIVQNLILWDTDLYALEIGKLCAKDIVLPHEKTAITSKKCQ